MAVLEQKEPKVDLKELKNDHDLVHEMSKHLDVLCDYAERIADPEGSPEMQETWRELERQEQIKVRHLREMIIDRIDKGVFLNDL